MSRTDLNAYTAVRELHSLIVEKGINQPESLTKIVFTKDGKSLFITGYNGNGSFTVNAKMNDLKLSLDDFSDRFLCPIAEAIKSGHKTEEPLPGTQIGWARVSMLAQPSMVAQ